MGLFSKLLGYRWSLYIVQHENQLVYAMHENSVIRMVGYVMGYFANQSQPASPWGLVLNFNRTHKSIKLRPEHFTPDGKDVSKLLLQEIQAIDPGWKVKGSDPVFEDASTTKKLPISRDSLSGINFNKIIDDVGKPKEITFYDVMDHVFEKR